MALAGIADPLRDLPGLHTVLDFVEQQVAEAKAHEGGDALERFWFELYRPEDDEVKQLIATADTDTDFDAFAAMAGAG